MLNNTLIYIVENDAGNLAIASHYLRQAGVRIRFDRWGVDTPDNILKAMPVSVILMDLMFPQHISGFDIFQQIQQVPKLRAVPVVAVSAMDPDIAMPRAMQLGFASFIAKPIAASIVRHVADVIHGKKVWVAVSDDF